MRIEYDSKTNALYFHIKKSKVDMTFFLREGVLIDFDKKGDVVGIKVLNLHPKLGRELKNAIRHKKKRE